MKTTKKNLRYLFLFFFLGFMAGTLAWEVLELILDRAGVLISWGTGPIGFDLEVVSFYVQVNPGSFLGIGAGYLLFRSL